ncbi:MAG: thioredoxin [Solirubrobacteraceae bacterium]
MDVTEATFQRDVIERSRQVPVVVDFWAEWCGPCRQLGPVIEKAVAKREGKVDLVKVDVDSNQALARTYGIQSIPAVKAFKDGKVAGEFVGAQPPTAVEQFLNSLVPSEADALVAQGDEASLRRAVELEPSRADAAVPLAKIMHSRGELEAAQKLLAKVPRSFAADGLAARIDLERAAADEAPPAIPGLSEGLKALDEGDYETSLDKLLTALPEANGYRDDLRRVIVGILDELGVDHPLARESRRRLAAALY